MLYGEDPKFKYHQEPISQIMAGCKVWMRKRKSTDPVEGQAWPLSSLETTLSFGKFLVRHGDLHLAWHRPPRACDVTKYTVVVVPLPKAVIDREGRRRRRCIASGCHHGTRYG